MDVPNSRVDEFIMANLPASFGVLVRLSPNPVVWYRPIDRGLQRLRKAGRIVTVRNGATPVWRTAD